MFIRKLAVSVFVPVILGFFFSCEPGPSSKGEIKALPSPTNTEVEGPKTVSTLEKSNASTVPSGAEEGDSTAKAPRATLADTVNPANGVQQTIGLTSKPLMAQEILSITTDADVQRLEDRITKMTDEQLTQTITNLEKAEAEAEKKSKPVPAIQVALAACYGRKGLIDRAYTAIVRAEKAAKAPGVVFSLSAVYGRKELLAMDPRLSPCAMVLESNPPGALLRVDGTEIGTTPTRAEGLRPGVHTVKAELPGFEPYQESVEGNLGETIRVQATLTIAPVEYILDTEPPAESITLDGTAVDHPSSPNGPWTGTILPGKHTLKAHVSGYNDLETELTVPLGPGNFRSALRLTPKACVLTVDSTPTGSSVIIDNKKIGVTPLRYETLDFGEKDVSIVSSDWRYQDSVSPKVVLGPGIERGVSKDLERKIGNFTLQDGPSMPVGATVFINDQPFGTVPIFNKPLPYDNYTLKIVANQYEVLSQPIRWEGHEEALPRALKKQYVEIPVRTIKIDGKLDDWANLDPILTDPVGNDTMPKQPGTDVTALYMAKDKSYLYWRIDFADGKPQWSTMALDDQAIQCDLVFEPVSYKGAGGYQLDLRVQMNKNGKYFGLYQVHKNGTMVEKNENILYAMGPSFLEARIPLSSIQKMIGGVQSVLVRVYTGPQKVSTYMMTTKRFSVQMGSF
jgi:hypothetical protein